MRTRTTRKARQENIKSTITNQQQRENNNNNEKKKINKETELQEQ